MPIRKFRSLQEMEDSLWREPGVALWRAIASVWNFGARTVGHRFPPGVHKHRSIEDAEKLRTLWEDENFRRYHASRRSDPEA